MWSPVGPRSTCSCDSPSAEPEEPVDTDRVVLGIRDHHERLCAQVAEPVLGDAVHERACKSATAVVGMRLDGLKAREPRRLR